MARIVPMVDCLNHKVPSSTFTFLNVNLHSKLPTGDSAKDYLGYYDSIKYRNDFTSAFEHRSELNNTSS